MCVEITRLYNNTYVAHISKNFGEKYVKLEISMFLNPALSFGSNRTLIGREGAPFFTLVPIRQGVAHKDKFAFRGMREAAFHPSPSLPLDWTLRHSRRERSLCSIGPMTSGLPGLPPSLHFAILTRNLHSQREEIRFFCIYGPCTSERIAASARSRRLQLENLV